MLEYVFFNAEPCDRFCGFLSDKGLEPSVEHGDPERIVVIAEEAVDDALADEIDAFYDEMFSLDQTLFDSGQSQSPDDYHAAGVVVNLRDGRAVYADVPPLLLRKVMEALSPEELGDFVNAVVDAVERPDERTFCQRMRDEAVTSNQ